jgi:hypothetical protein
MFRSGIGLGPPYETTDSRVLFCCFPPHHKVKTKVRRGRGGGRQTESSWQRLPTGSDNASSVKRRKPDVVPPSLAE